MRMKSTDIEGQIAGLARGLRQLYADLRHPQVDKILADWPNPDRSVPAAEPARLPVTAWLSQAAQSAPEKTSAVVRASAGLSADLRWQQTYSADDLSPRFLARYGWTLLVGSEAPISNASLLAGLLMLGPDVEYPPHQHSAEETYIILSGTASWRLGDADWTPLPPGAFVHNPSWRLHGMRTDQHEPLLLAFLWNAAVVEKSKMHSPDSTNTGNQHRG